MNPEAIPSSAMKLLYGVSDLSLGFSKPATCLCRFVCQPTSWFPVLFLPFLRLWFLYTAIKKLVLACCCIECVHAK